MCLKLVFVPNWWPFWEGKWPFLTIYCNLVGTSAFRQAQCLTSVVLCKNASFFFIPLSRQLARLRSQHGWVIFRQEPQTSPAHASSTSRMPPVSDHSELPRFHLEQEPQLAHGSAFLFETRLDLWLTLGTAGPTSNWSSVRMHQFDPVHFWGTGSPDSRGVQSFHRDVHWDVQFVSFRDPKWGWFVDNVTYMSLHTFVRIYLDALTRTCNIM